MNRQVSVNQQQILSKKFSGHKYILSPIGVIHVIVAILFLVGPIISLSAQVCSQYGLWLELTFPIVTVVCGVLLVILYVIFIIGLSKKNTKVWIKIDLISSTVYAVFTLVLSILLLANCSNQGALSVIPGIIGIVGALLLFVKSAITFVKWQNTQSTEDEEDKTTATKEAVDLKRKSIFI